MFDTIAQATTMLNAEWIIGGLASAFGFFAVWVGKFLKQIWGDIKVIWSEFKVMHTNQIQTLESVIGKQDEATEKIQKQTTDILAHTKKIEKQNVEIMSIAQKIDDDVTAIKYSLKEFRENLAY